MSELDRIKKEIISAVLAYDLQSIHNKVMNLIDEIENSNINMDSVLINEIFIAYQRHDYLYLSDLLEYDL